MDFIRAYLNVVLGVLIGVILVLGITVFWQHSEINSMQETIDSLTAEVLVANKNTLTCKDNLLNQNKAIDAMASDSLKKEKEFQEWKSKPVKERFKVEREIIYKDVNVTIPSKERSCDELKKIESNVYDLDWNK